VSTGHWTSLIKALARRAGIDIQRYSPKRSAGWRRACILDHERISLVLDVGANVGRYGRQLREAGYSGRIVSFEPQTEQFAQLAHASARDPGWECRCVALGDADRTAEVRVAQESGVSSLLALEPALSSTPGWATIATEPAIETRLDSFAHEMLTSDDRTCLKIDVQGYELHVLRGAERTLKRISVVEAELNLVPLYQGQPALRDMLEFFDAAGFRLAALSPGDFVEGPAQTVFVDAIFVRRQEIPGLVEALAWTAPATRRARTRDQRGERTLRG
jgi:FkbM family methyltransferase